MPYDLCRIVVGRGEYYSSSMALQTLFFSLPLVVIALLALAWAWHALGNAHHQPSDDGEKGD